MNLRKNITQGLTLLKSCYQHYLHIFVFLQLIVLFISFPIMKTLLGVLLYINKASSLDLETLLPILMNPMSWLVMILIFIVAMLTFYFEVTTLVSITYAHQESIPLTLRYLLTHAYQQFKRVCNWRLIYIGIYFILLIPVANLGLTTMMSERMRIPDFIAGEFSKNVTTSILYSAALLVVAYVNIRCLYTLPLLVLSDLSILDTVKKSWQLTKRNSLKILLVIVSVFIAMSALMIGVYLLIDMIIDLLDKQVNPVGFVIAGILLALLIIATFISNMLPKLMIINWLVRTLKEMMPLTIAIPQHNRKTTKTYRRLFIFTSIIVLFTTSIALLFVWEFTNRSKILAHRGYVAQAVENSIPALEAAAAYHVDYVEMDIIETKDQHFIVMHDYNLKRLANLNKKVADLTFEQVHQLPIHADGHQATIPSLEEYIEKAKALGVKLNIEYKPHGKEDSGVIDRLITILKTYQVEDKYIVQSLKLAPMEELNRKMPSIRVGYITPFQFGGLPKADVDFFVVEESSFNTRLLAQAHQQNQELYIWTINSEEGLLKGYMDGVDGMITDELELAKTVKERLENKQSLKRIWQNIADYLVGAI